MKRQVLAEIAAERDRQDRRWGEQNHGPALFFAILSEEVGEVAKEIAESQARPLEGGNYRAELVQVAAVAAAMIEAYDRAAG